MHVYEHADLANVELDASLELASLQAVGILDRRVGQAESLRRHTMVRGDVRGDMRGVGRSDVGGTWVCNAS